MTGGEHYDEAERIVRFAKDGLISEEIDLAHFHANLAAARVHAALALADYTRRAAEAIRKGR